MALETICLQFFMFSMSAVSQKTSVSCLTTVIAILTINESHTACRYEMYLVDVVASTKLQHSLKLLVYLACQFVVPSFILIYFSFKNCYFVSIFLRNDWLLRKKMQIISSNFLRVYAFEASRMIKKKQYSTSQLEFCSVLCVPLLELLLYNLPLI